MVFLVLVICTLLALSHALHNPYCARSCRIGDKNYPHTVCERQKNKCGPSLKCGGDFHEIQMTDDLRQYALDLHNEFRNRVASGKERRGGHQPSASNMLTMKYNIELEFIAQCWANNCEGSPLKHDVCRSTKQHEHVGQNLGHIKSSSAPPVKDSLRKLITRWYDEVALFRREWVTVTQNRSDIMIGHFTQMLWAETDSLGCALAAYTSPNPYANIKQLPTRRFLPVYGEVIVLPPKINKMWHNLLLVCNYAPGGNYVGAPLYVEGVPCSKCPPGQGCSSYPSLCGQRTSVNNSHASFAPFFPI